MFLYGGNDYGNTLIPYDNANYARYAGIRTGMASTEIVVPRTTAARIRTKTALSGVKVGDGFTVKDGAYSTLALLGGQQPVLTIDLQSALGSVSLKMDDSIALPA